MTQRKSAHHPVVSVTVQTPAPRPRAPRAGLRVALIGATLFCLAVGIGTLVFWYVVLSSELLIVNDTELYFIRNVGLIGLLIGGLGLFITIGTFRRAALPTADLLEAIERATAGDLNIQVQERGPREIRTLTRAFNDFLSQEQTRDQTQRHLTAEVAHELQARLSTLDTSAHDSAPARLAQDWYTWTLVENNALVLQRETLDLGALVREILTALHPQASACGVTLRAEIADPAPIGKVDRARLWQVLQNLVLYALARSTSGAEIKVDVSEERKPHVVQIAVTDHGRVLTPSELKNLFVQMSQASPLGTGLELPLAAQLVDAHGGRIAAESSAEQGTTVAFILPLD